MKNQTSYPQHIRQCFTDAFRFMEAHMQARTDADFKKVATSLSPYKDPLTVALIVACMNEIEREYQAHTSQEGRDTA